MFIIFVFTPSIFFYQKSQNFNTELLILKYHLKTKWINFMNLKFLILKKKIECGRMFLFIRCLYNAYRMDISRNCVNQIKYKHWKNYQCSIGVYFVYVTNDLENVLSIEYILSWMKTLDWGWTFNRLMIMGLWPINKLFSNIKTNNVSSYWIKQCWSMHQKKTCLYFRRYMHCRTG